MILVTGANGFLGNLLISKFKSLGLDIKAIVFGNEFINAENSCQMDLNNIDHIEKLKKSNLNPEIVIHLAGYIDIVLKENIYNLDDHPLPGNRNITKLYNFNVGTTANLIEFCLEKKVKLLMFASSQAVYGMPADIPLTEDSPCNPLEHYAASKLCAEHLLEVASRQGLNVIIFRFPGLYSQTRKSGVIYNFCKNAIEKKHISVEISYPLPIDVIHVEDVIDAFVKALNMCSYNFLRLNIATGEPSNMNLLASLVAQIVPGCSVDYSSVWQPTIIMNSSRASSILGWVPRTQKERLKQVLESIKNDY